MLEDRPWLQLRRESHLHSALRHVQTPGDRTLRRDLRRDRALRRTRGRGGFVWIPPFIDIPVGDAVIRTELRAIFDAGRPGVAEPDDEATWLAFADVGIVTVDDPPLRCLPIESEKSTERTLLARDIKTYHCSALLARTGSLDRPNPRHWW